jgi:hypothetical protein
MESKTKAQKSFLIRIPISHEEVKFMSDLIVLLSMLMANQSRLFQRFFLPLMQKRLMSKPYEAELWLEYSQDAEDLADASKYEPVFGSS